MQEAAAVQIEWFEERATCFSGAKASTEMERRRRQVVRYAQKAQYGRGAAAPVLSGVLSPSTLGVLEKLETLHPAPPSPFVPVPVVDMLPAPTVTEAQV